jgi:RimJ/RimL family protein N-acetyltransferase
MSAGVRLAVDHAFHHLGLHRLEANIQPDNQASIHLVKKLGFRKEGFRRDISVSMGIGVITSVGLSPLKIGHPSSVQNCGYGICMFEN